MNKLVMTSLFSPLSRTLVMALALFSLCPLSAAQGPGQVLHNGIRLPSRWPIADRDAGSREPMPVPYLKEIPSIIPIDVGRQLFVDDFLIESTTLTRTFHSAQKYEGNPMVVPQTKDELEGVAGLSGSDRSVCYLGHGGVFFNPADQRFVMFYTSGWRGGLSKVTSTDGLGWARESSPLGGNLFIKPGGSEAGGDNAVWFDAHANNPAERIKFMSERAFASKTRRTDPSTHTLHTLDGNGNWTSGVPAGRAADYCSFFYNPFRKVWVYSIKREGPHGRTRYYAESSDFVTENVFDRSVFWVGADRLDKPDPQIGDTPQLYSLSGIAYESIILGAFQIHLGPRNSICHLGLFPKITEIQLGFSRDGFHWDRPSRKAFIAPTKRDGDWDRSYVHSTTGVCLVVGDKLYFPYSAYSGAAPSGERGTYTGGSIGMAMLRRDGFASMDAGESVGALTTRPVTFNGRHLFVNVNTASGGSLRVEILDRNGKIIGPFSAENCVPVSKDSTLCEITWRGAKDLAALRGQPVQFRFHLKQGGLYAFWVSPDKSGASHGYVAAGGPGFDAPVDTRGEAAYQAAKIAGGRK